MTDIIKILQAYKSNIISEKQLNNFLNIKKRSQPNLIDLGNDEGFQVWADNTCLLITLYKEVAENFIALHNKHLKLILSNEKTT
tara:strand:+ start:6601 stop:6852 length:252 start_codon:yes stop_codon:yes gene_type:complete